ncbi:MAG: (2Fe-2S)-binding protein [Elusimicrobiales bacterium]|nr:(2Fe-2S)-binding protein [Elusimicrobiales bacterium]
MKKLLKNKEGLIEIGFKLNGTEIETSVKPNETLLDLIRRLGYKGTKKGCDTGDCGSCTIIIDGIAKVSCLLPAFYAEGKEIITIEGLGDVSNPHPIQKAYADSGAVQCGFCIPGMIMTTKFLLDRNPKPSDSDIKHALDGNLCRCTGYVKQIEAVKIAASKINKK